MSKPLTLSQRLSLRAYASDEECRTDDADIMREADEAISAKDAELSILAAQNEWLKDRLSNLQLPANSHKNIEEWLAECGMPTALSKKEGTDG